MARKHSEEAESTIQEIEEIVKKHEAGKHIYGHHSIVLEQRVFDEGTELYIRSKQLSGFNARLIFSAIEDWDFEILSEDSTTNFVVFLQ